MSFQHLSRGGAKTLDVANRKIAIIMKKALNSHKLPP